MRLWTIHGFGDVTFFSVLLGLGLLRVLIQSAMVKCPDISGFLGEAYTNSGRWIRLPEETFYSKKYCDLLNL